MRYQLLACIVGFVVSPGVESSSCVHIAFQWLHNLFPLDTAICAGQIIILGFIRNVNSRYEDKPQLLTPSNPHRHAHPHHRVLPRCSLWKMAADCCSYKHPRATFIDCETMLSPTPPHHSRFTRQLSSAPQRVCVCACMCVWMAEQVSQSHPASVGGLSVNMQNTD